MKVVRLLVLGLLSARGPTYGHQLRRAIDVINVEAWSEIRAGSLYHALHQMEAEGLVEPVRTERQGRLPARTVYAITAQGRSELEALRDRALREIRLGADPFDVALWTAAGAVPAADLEVIVRQRIETLRVQLDGLAGERRQHDEAGHLPPAGRALMRHGEARMEAELRWHHELLAMLPEIERTVPWPGAEDVPPD